MLNIFSSPGQILSCNKNSFGLVQSVAEILVYKRQAKGVQIFIISPT